jgi:T-complex protein 1 subunit gamma
MCSSILAFKPDIVCTEKGLSDLAQHYFVKHGVTAFRRLRKSDNNRIARACGATIVSRADELKEVRRPCVSVCEGGRTRADGGQSDVGTGCGVFEVRKIGDEFFAFFEKCKNPKACSILLRGAGKDVLNEVERNLQDAMSVARNILMDPRLLPGGGATEMALSVALQQKSQSIDGVSQYPYRGAPPPCPSPLAARCLTARQRSGRRWRSSRARWHRTAARTWCAW